MGSDRIDGLIDCDYSARDGLGRSAGYLACVYPLEEIRSCRRRGERQRAHQTSTGPQRRGEIRLMSGQEEPAWEP